MTAHAAAALSGDTDATSFAQLRLWMIDRLVEDRALYNTGLRFALDGPLDVDALRAALQTVVARHEILRCGFSPEDGRLQVQPRLAVTLRIVAGPADTVADDIERLQREDLAVPFDLAQPPLFRWTLFRHADQRHELLLTIHHIVFDGASVDLLLHELAQAYPACLRGEPVPLPPLQAQCADEALAERRRLDDDTREHLLAFWRRTLDAAPVLDLPTDRPRPPRMRHCGDTERRTRDRAWRDALDATCRRERTTPFMCVLAVYAAWLCRYSGQNDVVVGTPFAARDSAESRALIGFFVNTLALRLQGDPGHALRDWLRLARETSLAAFRHARMPFGDLIAALGGERESAHPPLAQAMLVVQGRRAPVALDDALTMRYLGEVPGQRARFDLALVMDERDEGVEFALEYDRDLFDPATAARMLDHLLVLMDAAIADPACPVERLPMLSAADRARLRAWSQEIPAPALDAPRRFARLAAEAPDAPAIHDGDRTLGRGALQARAERLAAVLLAEGIVAGARVGVCLPRGADFATTVLALWTCGAAYLPMDPEHPPSRHAWLVADAGLHHVLTVEALAPRFEEAGARTLTLSHERLRAALADDAPGARLTIDAAADVGDAVAYVIHTSGSTGEPKGVEVGHEALARLLDGPAAMGYDRDSHMLASVNPAFDASILELWGPLCAGGQVTILPQPTLELPTLRATIARTGVDTVTLPASLLDLWVDMLDGPTGLSRIVVGGESLSIETIRRLYAIDPDVVAINHYGPTENGILTTYHPIARDTLARGTLQRMPIGVAVPGTALHVVDRLGHWQPPGVVGELVVAGHGLARGYLDRAALTAERFASFDPESDGSAIERGYRTGDLVRWDTAGGEDPPRLLFVGRVDQQLKIRGFRIEPGEIEARLRACAGVRDARVLVREVDGDRRLVAYALANEGDPARWRADLQRVLPAYMVPAAIVRVDAWPLTRNGKFDAAALPAPDDAAIPHGAGTPPRTARERWLHDVWCALLGAPRVGVEDNFFALGGHSLLATRLHHRIRVETGADLPLRAIFDAPDLAAMAAAIDAAVAATTAAHDGSVPNAGRADARAPLAPRAPGEDAPLSFAQQRLWFVQSLEPDSAQYHIPYRLRLDGVLDASALHASLQAMVERHAVLRTRIVETGNVPRQRILEHVDLVVEHVDLRGRPADAREVDAAARMRAHAARPFDLRREPPIRALLLRLGEASHVLALTLHHIAADGASMAIFEREWAALYAAFATGTDPALPPLALQYADYAGWERATHDDAALAAKLDAMQARLQGAPAVHDLPLDRPRPPVRGRRGAVRRQRLPAAQIERCTALARQHDATLFMLLHAAFAVLIARFGGNPDVVIGSPVAQRRDDALTPLIGLFLNTLALRSDVSDDPSFLDLLARTRDVVLEAFDAQDVPLDLLIERLRPARSTAHTPLFQVLFALQDLPVTAPTLPGLQASALDIDDRDAKFDLALNLLQDGDGILAEWDYDADLFDADSIDAMASAYAVLLDAIVAAPDTRVGALPLLDAAGRARMLTLGNDTDRPYPLDACLHEAFEAHAARTPDAIALRFEATDHRYAEVNAEANRLARRLHAAGVGPDMPVAIAMPRHPALVVALLAILKAGGTFVAIDPNAPAQRLRHLLVDSGAGILLTHAPGAALREALDALDTPPEVLDPIVDATSWSDLAADDLAPADTGLRADHGAYLIYTSGSTGQPKGVINTHAGIVNRMRWMQERYPLRAGDRFLQTAAIGFGAAVLEIFWPLHAGATVLLARPDGYKDPTYLIDLIVREQVRAVHFVPSLLRAFLEHPRAADAGRLDRIFCGGELLSADVARRCRALLPDTRLHHLYGSSEAAVLSTQWDVTDDPLPERIPIGRPGANTRLYLLDERGEPVPRGMRGEIHVAGRQVARGYLHRPAQTAERFLSDPARPGSGERMFRSGDLGRYRSDGSIEYLGRNDFQIKIRGQRVEPGEIEAQLAATAGIAQAVVAARDLGDGDQWLVAYLVPQASDQVMDADTLIEAARRQAAATLPDFMQPAAYAVLARLPLNANGKLDRAALPLPVARAGGDATLRTPETPLQQALAEVWRTLMPDAEFGIDSDFFALGGHSLLALRLANRLREDYGYELELKPFFASPTIRALAETLECRLGARRALERFHAADMVDIVEF
jgi:amino acid adenylation domain-containing protein